jgi:hypothetical protein
VGAKTKKERLPVTRFDWVTVLFTTCTISHSISWVLCVVLQLSLRRVRLGDCCCSCKCDSLEV